MEKIIFDKNFADKLCSIMRYNKVKTYFYADDFLKVFPVTDKNDFYEAINVSSFYISQFIKKNKNYVTYENKKFKLSIEGIFYALMFVQNNKDEKYFNEIFNQIYLLVPRSAFEKRLRARELYIQENNKMASNLSRRFPNRAEAQRVIRQFNTEIINGFYNRKLEDVVVEKGIRHFTESKSPNYLDYVSAKELMKLYYLKKQCNMLLDEDVSYLSVLKSISSLAVNMSENYREKYGEYPIQTPCEELKISKLKSEMKYDGCLKSFSGPIEFKNIEEEKLFNNFKKYLEVGTLTSFDVLEK